MKLNLVYVKVYLQYFDDREEVKTVKKFLSSLFIISVLFLLSTITNASEPLPTIYINNAVVNTGDNFIFKDGTTYVKPYVISDLFHASFSYDVKANAYTFSNGLRNASYNTSEGTLNITDKNSFLFEIYEKSYPAYIHNNTEYFPLRMMCTVLGHKIEYIPLDNSIRISTIQDGVGIFNSQGTAIAMRGGKYGLVNQNGDILLNFLYDKISNFDNPLLFKLTSHSRSGLANTNGKKLTEIAYDEIRYESPSAIYLKNDRKWGMCDISGTIIVPVVYDDVTYCANLIAMVKSASKWYVLNCKTGELSQKHYDEVYRLTTGVQTDNKMINGYYVKRGEKWGYIDSFGKVVIDTKYDALDKFDEKGRARFLSNDKFGVIDCGGKIIIPPAYDYLGMFGNLSVTVAQVGNNYGIINDKFEVVSPFEYDYIYSFNDKPATVAYKDSFFGIISTQGKPISDFKYTYMEDFNGGLALAFDGGYGYVNHNGNEVIDTIHSEVRQGTTLSFFLKYHDKWALYSPNGENLTGYIYTNVGSFANGLSAVSQITDTGEKFGYINDRGDIIIPCIYDSALDFKYGKAIVRKGKYSGIINVEGETIIPFVYTGFNSSYDHNVIASADEYGKWGLISFKNEKLCDFKYDYIFEFENGFAYTIKDHKYGIIDASGNEIAKPQFKTKEDALNSVF